MFTGIGGFEKGIEQAYYMNEAKKLALASTSSKKTGCVVVKNGKIIGKGSNTHQEPCKRVGFPTGVGYDLCEGCNYDNHAEANALRDIDAENAELYLYGHYYLCEPCQEKVLASGVAHVFIRENNELPRNAEAETERLRTTSAEEVRVGSGGGSPQGHEELDGSTTSPLEHDLDSTTRQPHCVGYSEIDKWADKVFQYHYKGVKNYGDATTINTDDLPDFDLLVGGFPCQAFSIAGKRRGFLDETRGTLFFEVARILKDKRPRYFILENVKGLLSHDSGKTYQTILGVLTDLGYTVEWQLLNSKDFGVPQNRERIYIVGCLGGRGGGQVFPLRYSSSLYPATRTDKKEVHAGTLTARQFSSWNGNFIRQINQPTHSNDRVYDPEGISPTLNTMQGGNRQPFITAKAVLTPNRPVKRQNGRRVKDDGDPAFTVNTQDRHGVLLNDERIRRLTPIECERLQGFYDNWTAIGLEYCKTPTSCPPFTRKMCSMHEVKISDSQRYKMAGNAVTTNVVQAVVERLL